jgi:hypothetical protein
VRIRPSHVVLVAALAITAAGCGSSGSKSTNASGDTGKTSTSLVAKVTDAKAQVEGKKVVASAKVEQGGKPGEHLELKWGLVDAISGVRASKQDEVAAKYVTTSEVKDETATISFKLPVPTDYLVHFALYAPDGTYLSSSDSDVFTVSSPG